MSIDPAHAFAACRALRVLGGPTYLLHSRELDTIWVGAAAREDAAGRGPQGGAGFFSALRAERKPAFFLFGSEAVSGGREPAHALCVRPLVELRFDASGARAVFHGAPTSGLKATVDAALAAQPGTAPPPSASPFRNSSCPAGRRNRTMPLRRSWSMQSRSCRDVRASSW